MIYRMMFQLFLVATVLMFTSSKTTTAQTTGSRTSLSERTEKFSEEKSRISKIARANGYMDGKHWAEAAALYREITGQYPKDGEAWYQLGGAYYFQKKFDEAIVAFSNALNSGYRNAGGTMYDLACVYALNDDKDAAFKWLDRAAKSGFSNANAIIKDPDLASLRTDLRWNKLLDSLGLRYAELRSEVIIADELINKKDWAKATSAYQIITKKYPTDGRGWYRLGLLHNIQGQNDESIKAFEKASELPFDRLNAAYNVAAIYARQGNKEESLKWLKQALNAGLNPEKATTDADFKELRADPQWINLISQFTLSEIRSDTDSVGERRRDYYPTNGWRSAKPETYGMDSRLLSAAVEYITDEWPKVNSLLVVRNGYLVKEQYFNGYKSTDAYNVKSVTKSFMSSLIGMALEKGYFKNIDQPVTEILPKEYHSSMDERKKTITLRHLLTMTAGFKWVENGDVTKAWEQSDDLIKFTLELPLDAAPGEKFNYNTAVSHLLSVALSQTAGTNTYEFARKELFDPLGITLDSWLMDPKGYYMGGSEMRWTPREMAKFGYLYLNKGRWNGRPIIPAQWVEKSTSEQAPGFSKFRGYGYQWWITNVRGYKTFYALGFGGQYIFVVPDLDIVVVLTSEINNPQSRLDPVMWQFIIPAIESYQAMHRAE